MCGQQIIEFLNKTSNGGDKLDEAFRNEHHTKVMTLGCTVGHHTGDIFNDIVQCEILLLDFL